MDFKSLLSQLDQLNEATEKTKTGVKHTAEPGGYGRKDDEDDEGKKVKAKDTEKKGRGRPKKATQSSGEDKKYDFSAFGVKHGKDVKLPKYDKKKTTKHSLKEYLDSVHKAMTEGEQPAEIPQKAIDRFNEPNKKFYTKNPHFARGTEVKNIGKTVDASGKPVSALATKVTPKFNKPDPVTRLSRGSFNTSVEEAEQIEIKPASQMPKKPGQTSQPGQQPQQVAGQAQKNTQVIQQGDKVLGSVDNPQLAQQIKQSIGKGEMTLMPDEEMHEEDIGKHNNATTGFDALVKKLTPKYGVEAAKRIAGAQLKKIREGDAPGSDFNMLSPISGSGLSEGKKAVKKDDKAEKAGKKVTKDLEYDMGHKGKDDKKAERAGKKVTKDIEYDMKKKKIKEAAFKQEYRIFLESKGIKVTNEMLEEGWKEKLATVGTAAAIGATSLGMMGGLPGQNPSNSSVTKPTEFSQQVQAGQQVHTKAEAMAKVNKQFANEYYTGLNKIDKDYSNGSPKLANQKAVEFTQQLLAKYQANESKKPDANKNGIPDYAEDGKGKNDLKKKKVKEGMDHRLKAAYHEGKAHGLSKRAYNCTHDDMEEARQYHEGYKCGLDECYGQMPVQGLVVGENNPSVVDNMASFGAHTPEVEEGNAFTAALAKTPAGGKFSLGGKTFTDRSALESRNPFDINEDVEMKNWDSELDSLLNENAIAEGVTISSSTGQQGSPDSVTVSASDADASAVLNMIKQLGLGGFGGGEEQSAGQPMTVDVNGGEGPEAEIEVVDDHDDMLSLIRKMTGQGSAQASGDYEDEEGGHEEHGHEEACETCNESPCGCNEEEVVDEEQSEDQMEYQVAETEGGGDDAEEQEEMASDATRDAALAQSSAEQDPTVNEGGEAGSDAIAADDAADIVDAEEEDLDESYANSADDTFESDIDFMTKVISGGLNKQKSTGQTTIPVVSTQMNRLGTPMKESTDLLTDWKKLSGIK